MKPLEAQVFALVLGQIVATLRERRDWTQAGLAGRVGVSQSVISRWERGTLIPDAYDFGVLAGLFGMTGDRLHAHIRDTEETTHHVIDAVTKTSTPTKDEAWRLAISIAGLEGLRGLAVYAVAVVLSKEYVA